MVVLQKCNTCHFKWSVSSDGEGFDTCPSCDSEQVEREEEAMKEIIQVKGSEGWRTLCAVQDPSEMKLAASDATRDATDILHALRSTYQGDEFRVVEK